MRLGNSAFSSCMGLRRLVIPDGVTEIGSDAFYFCANLKRLVLPQSLKGTSNNSLPRISAKSSRHNFAKTP
ncbi:MAG: leucine-rich repeat protein [Ruminococcus sp.]|nr:leucine-rich repeat protein [Ruminococcus sp.]